jgi:HD-GYP domain-containing protein (c-di-GMP phosphodiesterase class II)
LKLDANSIRGLIKGAFLHDVGKIGVSDSILLKPGRLSEIEFDKMKRHVQHGVDIIRSSDWLYDAAEVVGYHHEKYGGKGYPFGLQGGQIPLNARIFAIADVFDALTSRRPYKEPYSLEKTLQILGDMRDNHLDPVLLDAFIPIAPDLYRDLANGDGQAPHRELESIIGRYFKRNVGELFRSAHAVLR